MQGDDKVCLDILRSREVETTSLYSPSTAAKTVSVDSSHNAVRSGRKESGKWSQSNPFNPSIPSTPSDP